MSPGRRNRYADGWARLSARRIRSNAGCDRSAGAEAAMDDSPTVSCGMENLTMNRAERHATQRSPGFFLSSSHSLASVATKSFGVTSPAASPWPACSSYFTMSPGQSLFVWSPMSRFWERLSIRYLSSSRSSTPSYLKGMQGMNPSPARVVLLYRSSSPMPNSISFSADSLSWVFALIANAEPIPPTVVHLSDVLIGGRSMYPQSRSGKSLSWALYRLPL